MTATYNSASDTYRDSTGTYRAGYGGDRHYITRPARVDWRTSPASEKQKSGIEWRLSRLASSKPEVYSQAVAYWQGLEDPTGEQASKMIDALNRHLAEVEVRPATRIDFKAIPDGNYAIRSEGVVKFYRVKMIKGFKRVQIRASDALYPTTAGQGAAIMRAIFEVGLETSQKLFADELGRCYTCGKTLTDEESRACGQGPDCRSK